MSRSNRVHNASHLTSSLQLEVLSVLAGNVEWQRRIAGKLPTTLLISLLLIFLAQITLSPTILDILVHFLSY